MAEEKKVADWYVIEAEFRAGIKPLRQIAEENGITHGAINKRAKRDGWVRDLRAKIKAKADAEVSKRAVSKEVSKRKAVTEKMVIDTNVDIQVQIRESHRSDIRRVKSLLHMMLAEAEKQAEAVEADIFAELTDVLARAIKTADKEEVQALEIRDEIRDLNGIYRRAMALPARVGMLKQIAETLALLIKMEREAYGISDDDIEANPIDLLLRKIYKEQVVG